MATIRAFTSVAVEDGGNDGSITVADASGFYVGANARISSIIMPAKLLKVSGKTGNDIYFKDAANPFITPDLSAFKAVENVQVSQLAGTAGGFGLQVSTPKFYFGTTAAGGAGFLLSAANTPTPPCDGTLMAVGDIAIVMDINTAAKVAMFICVTAGYAAVPTGTYVVASGSVNAGAWCNNTANVYVCTTAGAVGGSPAAPTGTTTATDGTVTWTYIGTTTTYPVAAWKTIAQV
jgi:hypothetical protein